MRIKYILVVGLLAMAGCGVDRPLEPNADPYASGQINLTDKTLRSELVFQSPRMSRDNAGLLWVDVPVRSTADDQIFVDYRVNFLDQNGQVIEQGNDWRGTVIEKRSQEFIRFHSTTPLAANWHMDLRPSR